MYSVWLEGSLRAGWFISVHLTKAPKELNWGKTMDVFALLGNTVLSSSELFPNKTGGWG